MKSLFHVFFFGVTVFVLTACSSSKNITLDASPNAPNVIENPKSSLTLTDRLKTLASVYVEGSGGGAKIRIRGNNSILGENAPLFVLNNQIIDGGFSALYEMVDVANIKRIIVLKDSSSTSAYGIRGSNGVIKVELK